MARMRTLKPEACSSESLAAIPRAVRWTFSTLWTHCDDEGRAVRNMRLIKAAIYPLDDDMTPAAVEAELDQLERVGALCYYEVGGKPHLHVPAWHEHQHPNRPVPSKLPACPKTDHSPSAHAQRSEPTVSAPGALTPVVVVGVVDVGEKEGELEAAIRRPAQKRGTRIPDDWRPSENTRNWTLARTPAPAAALELEKFRNYYEAKTGKDATKLDWDKTWRNWVLNSAPGGRASPTRSTTESRVGDALARASAYDDEPKGITA